MRAESSARARRLEALADRAVLDVARLSGELASIERVRAMLSEVGAIYRDQLLSWPARVAPTLATALGCELAAVQRALQPEVERLLHECADAIEASKSRLESRAGAGGDRAPDGLSGARRDSEGDSSAADADGIGVG